jgi:hypothetical protein
MAIPGYNLGTSGTSGGAPGPGFDPSGYFQRMMQSMGAFGKDFEQNLEAPGGLFKNKEGAFRRAGGGKTGAVLGAVGTTLQDPIAGVVSAPIGLAAGQATNMLTNALTQGMMQGPLPAKAAGMALRYLAPSFVGYQAQQAAARGVQGLTGSASQAVEGATQAATGSGGLLGLGSGMQDLSLNLPIFGRVDIGERAKRRSEDEYQLERLRKGQDVQMQIEERRSALNRRNELEFIRATGQIQNQNTITQMKAMAPIIADAQRQQATIDQARLNTQIAGMQSLARMSGSFELAGRSMAESGALARTLAANSPYNAAMLPMPQIQFGG